MGNQSRYGSRMENRQFDVVVLGGGPGGYPAAIVAAQNGAKVALIENRELGGTCLNRGCIPSKALIANADILRSVQQASQFGIQVGPISFDYAAMVKRKDGVVERVRKGLEGLIAANKITLIRGRGQLVNPKEIQVEGPDACKVHGDKIILATGSEPKSMPAFPFDGKQIIDSTSILEMTTLPKKLIIIGGGIIGCEFASLYNALNVEVTILEMMPSIIPTEAQAVASPLTRAFQKKGIQIETQCKVERVEKTASGINVKATDGKTWTGDLVLVAVGRTLNTSVIGLDKAGVQVDPSGIIPTNEKMETNVPHIYAVGDIASKWWLAHVASHQGIVAAKNATGHAARMYYDAVPSVIFTVPEIGTVGLSLEAALKKGYPATVGAFPFQALGKSQASLHTDGFAQIVTDKNTGQILGAQVVGHEASTLIAEMAVAVANELTVSCISETIHAHPTVAEAWMEAALAAEGNPLHLPPKK